MVRVLWGGRGGAPRGDRHAAPVARAQVEDGFAGGRGACRGAAPAVPQVYPQAVYEKDFTILLSWFVNWAT